MRPRVNETAETAVDGHREGNQHFKKSYHARSLGGLVSLTVMNLLVAVPGVGRRDIDVSWPDGGSAPPELDAQLMPSVGNPTPLLPAGVGAAASFLSNYEKHGSTPCATPRRM